MYDSSTVEKDSYKHIPIVVDNYPENFQQNTNDLFHGLKFIRAYIDEILILTKGDWTDHVQELEIILNKMKKKNLNVILKRLCLI